MSEECGDWNIDPAMVAGLSRSEIADLCEYANAGTVAISLLEAGILNERCCALARQALRVLERLQAPDACRSVFMDITQERQSKGDLAAARGVMQRICDALVRQREKNEKGYRRAVEIRSC